MSLIKSVRRVANGRLQAELIDVVQLKKVNVLALLNKGDDAFNVGSVRHAWFPITMLSMEEMGVPKDHLDSVEKLQLGESFELNFKDPVIAGEKLRIQVIETVVPDKYQYQNALKAAKQIPITAEIARNKSLATTHDLSKYIGQTGYFVDKDGQHIFSRTIATIESQVNHTLVEGTLIPVSEMKEYGITLAEPTPVSKEEFAGK